MRGLLCSCKALIKKELKHTCCQLFIFIILCVSRPPEEVQINNDSQVNCGTNGRTVIRMLQHRPYLFSEAIFTQLISLALD